MSLLARLIEAGTPADLVAEVAEELARAKVAQEAINERRARDRERQQRRRDEAQHNVMSRDVTGQGVTPETTPLPLPPNEINSNPPAPTPANTTRPRKGHRLPEDWEPAPLTGETAAMAARWPEGAVDRELAKFRDWAASATGANSRKSDWDAAWRNWLRRRDDEQPRKPANDHQHSKPSGRNAADLARRMLGCD